MGDLVKRAASNELLNRGEILVLQELMNIAFGSASGELEEVLDIYVELKVPEVDVVPVGQLAGYFRGSSELAGKTCVVEQQFWGDFGGTGFMVLPTESGSVLLSVLEGYDGERFSHQPDEVLEQGAILEVGNILTGACIGKIAELLDTVVTYTPPQVRYSSDLSGDFDDLEKRSEVAIILKTYFHFTKEGVDGFIFVATREESLAWLKESITEYVEMISE